MAETEAKWYVVHTYAGYENKVAADLITTAENRKMKDMILEAKIPTEIVSEKVGDKTKEVEHKLYPGYVYRMGVEKRIVDVSYSVGDSVRIIDGPLEDFVGVVEELDIEKNYVCVVVSMYGRETPVELELSQAEPVDE